MIHHYNEHTREGSTATVIAKSSKGSDDIYLDELKPSDVLLRYHSKDFTAVGELVGFTPLVGLMSPFLSSISKTHSYMLTSCHEDMAFLYYLWALVTNQSSTLDTPSSLGLSAPPLRTYVPADHID